MNTGLNPIWEITILNVAEPGVPNRERIAIRPMQQVFLGDFGIGIGWRDDPLRDFIKPMRDQFYWFPNREASPPLWIFVYTGKGTDTETVMHTGEPALVFHWGRENTIFNFAEIVPVIYRVPDMIIGPCPSKPPLKEVIAERKALKG